MIGSKIIAGLAAMASAMQVTATSVQEFGTQFQRNQMHAKWDRAKTRGTHRVSGSKLARKAAKGRLGMATIR